MIINTPKLSHRWLGFYCLALMTTALISCAPQDQSADVGVIDVDGEITSSVYDDASSGDQSLLTMTDMTPDNGVVDAEADAEVDAEIDAEIDA